MTLIIIVTQDVSDNIKASESCSISLDDMKQNPELQILSKVEELKTSVMKKADAIVTKLLNNKPNE